MGNKCGSCNSIPEFAGHEICDGIRPKRSKAAFLSDVKIFRPLPQYDLATLAECTEEVTFTKDQCIIKQGDVGNAFFVIESGTASVIIDETEVTRLSDGEYFGELSLLRCEQRTASVVACTNINALKITRESFWHLGLNVKLEFPKRAAVGGHGQVVTVKPPSSKTEAERNFLLKAFRSNDNLNACIPIDEALAKELIGLMWKEIVPANTELIKQGDDRADYFYIVQEGSFAVTKTSRDSSMGVLAGDGTSGTISSGGSFGELALMYNAPRAATITATAQASVWVIDRDQFRTMIAKAEQAKGKEYVKHLNTVDILKDLNDAEKLEVANALTRMELSKDDVIFEQGESGDKFYLLLSGCVSVIKDNVETAKLTATSSKACTFGELALLHNKPRAATVKVMSETALALWMNKQSFEILIGPLEQLKKRGRNGTGRVTKLSVVQRATLRQESRFGKVLSKDLKRCGLLGCGGFGAVEMVEHVKTGDCYALKTLSKGFIIQAGTAQMVLNEKDVQLICDSPFIIKLYETYNQPSQLCLLLELAIGGELYATYMKHNLWGSQNLARFYVAGATLAFVHMHEQNIIYRDLKPENLLMTETGAVKLADMGLAKIVASKTFTTCGTPYYFAPEVIAASGYNNAVDWWTLGILTYELCVGCPPFDGESPMITYQMIRTGINSVLFPQKVRGLTEDFVKRLCETNPERRLPMKSGGAANIKGHGWFQRENFAWDKMENLTMTPPYRPKMQHKKDHSNFTCTDADLPPQLAYDDPGTDWDKGWETCS